MKQRRMFGVSMMLIGGLMVVLAFGSMPVQSAEPQSVQAAPSPRPTLPPVDDDDDDQAVESNPGHITGTVIELNSGAPAPGISVSITGVDSSAQVSSDSNGNYDRWVPAGVYTVTLSLRTEQGTAAQGPKVVEVTSGGRTVQHLYYRGLQATATAAPTSAAAPTSVAATAAPAPAPTAMMPTRLPRTAAPADSRAWLWLPIGLLLLLFGGLMTFMPSRRRAGESPDALLSRLLSEDNSKRR
jgi:hypothetical protein